MWLSTTIRSLVRWRRRRALAMELHALDDRALHDMGLNRGDIAAIASGSYILDETRRWRGGNCGGEAAGGGSADAGAWKAPDAGDAAR